MEETKEEKKNTSIFKVIKKAVAFAFKTQPKRYIFLIVSSAVLGLLTYVQFTTFSAIINEIIRIKDSGVFVITKNLISYSTAFGLSFLVPSILESIHSFVRESFRRDQITDMALYKIDCQASLDIATIESSWYQNRLQQANQWGVNSIVNLQTFIFSIIRSTFGIFASVGILFVIDYRLVILAICAAVPVYFFYRIYSMEVYRVRFFSTEDKRLIANRSNHFSDTFKLIDVVLLKLKSWLKEEVSTKMRDFDQKLLIAEKKKTRADVIMSVWYVACFFVGILLVTNKTLNGALAVGSLVLAFNSYRGFYGIVNSIFNSISTNQESAKYASQWFELFDLKPQIQNKDNAQKIEFQVPPLIEFKNVSFSYKNEKESKQVLYTINLVINPGEKVAIVGMNGAGKTTLIKLLCRVYDCDEGEILINGTNIKDIDLDSWHDCLGILFQDYPSYNISVRDAIAVGRKEKEIDEDKIVRAAKLSGADDFIEEFPKKYDQLIWKGFQDGVDLSKGQHQRLAVARMFYRDALITVLDEPTASIDAVIEEKIFNSLEQHMEGKTVVLITHKFSTVKNADRIVVLEHGHIVESGRHEELIKKKRRYEELYSMQASRYLESE
jgi:ATP-binding cassette subfamily B protein